MFTNFKIMLRTTIELGTFATPIILAQEHQIQRFFLSSFLPSMFSSFLQEKEKRRENIFVQRKCFRKCVDLVINLPSLIPSSPSVKSRKLIKQKVSVSIARNCPLFFPLRQKFYDFLDTEGVIITTGLTNIFQLSFASFFTQIKSLLFSKGSQTIEQLGHRHGNL